LREELEARGRAFRGHSDTEVILEACAKWGIERTLARLIGMFAIALWDRATRTLTLVRDRLGIKPLYWGLVDGLFLFGSELKALRAHSDWEPRLDRNALAAFMRHNYIPAPHSIYAGISKLDPGRVLTYRMGSQPIIKSYWDFTEIVKSCLSQREKISDAEATEQLDTLLRDAVRRRMIADVPLGALLSGGVDSSLVSALMQVQSPRPVKTFSVGFKESEYNEAPYAKAVATHLGTDHTELYVDPAHALEIIPRLPEWYDEPFADSSQIPTFLVCELTRQHVTVALTGDGGDELFAGYSRYFLASNIVKGSNIAPTWPRRWFASLLRRVSATTWDRIFAPIPRRFRPPQPGNSLHRLAVRIAPDDPDALYRQMISHWHEPDLLVLGSKEPRRYLWDSESRTTVPDFVERMQYLDTLTYLPDDILTKVDRASMAVALEARVPLLDHRVVEFAWKLPASFKIRSGQGKWLLRQVLYRYMPRSLIDRPKMGFGVPLDSWLRGPLREWAEYLLDGGRLYRQGVLNPVPVRDRWEAHVNRGQNWAYPLWNILMAQAWLERNKEVTM
jgi:asparagine synthase (glutamine-hydrolysing)